MEVRDTQDFDVLEALVDRGLVVAEPTRVRIESPLRQAATPILVALNDSLGLFTQALHVGQDARVPEIFAFSGHPRGNRKHAVREVPLERVLKHTQ